MTKNLTILKSDQNELERKQNHIKLILFVTFFLFLVKQAHNGEAASRPH